MHASGLYHLYMLNLKKSADNEVESEKTTSICILPYDLG